MEALMEAAMEEAMEEPMASAKQVQSLAKAETRVVRKEQAPKVSAKAAKPAPRVVTKALAKQRLRA